MEKAPDAFRTISEVADDLDIPAHVLRFWETRFSQIKPMKRSGGRRYYRPDDVELLRGIRRLLYGEGYTIRGVQRILREQGIKAVQGLGVQSAGEGGAQSLLSGPAERSSDGHKDRRARIRASAREELPEFEEDEAEDIDEMSEDEDEGETEIEVEVEVETTPTRRIANFKPAAAERVGNVRPVSKPLPEIPVATVSSFSATISPSPASLNSGYTGAIAYAPPSVRNSQSQRPVNQAKLQAVLDDLLGARSLLDRALKGDNPQS